MTFGRRALPIAIILSVVALTGLTAGNPARAAGSETLPDLRTVIPFDEGKGFSIIATPQGREFRYTHLVYNAGPGSLEVQPSYDAVSGGYRGVQDIYSLNGSTWTLSRKVRVPDTFVYHAAHGHFHFPLASFGLYAVASGGGIGDPVALSPKVGFCIDDSYVYNQTVAHHGETVGSRGACDQPLTLRGLSIGGADEYDYRDPGQAIPINGLADGTYWFKAVTDPYNDFVEADESNNETDVKVTIRNGEVIPGEVRTPDTTPPAGSLVSPAEGSVVSGTASLTATSPDADVASVSFLVDGEVVATVDSAPYAAPWHSTSVVDGTHWFAARITDRAGRTATTPVRAATVSNTGPTTGAGLSLAGSVSRDGRGTVTTAVLSQLAPGDQLVALVSSDGPEFVRQSATVTSGSGGLSWTLVKRANTRPGTSEIWQATVPASTSSATATAALDSATNAYDVSLTLLAFHGSGGIGASALASGTSGAPGVNVSTTAPGSWVYAVGSDWTSAAARVFPSGQNVVHQWLTGSGDGLWSQAQTTTTPSAGTTVRSNLTAPTSQNWNMAAVEVKTSITSDRTPPRVSVSDPVADSTLTGKVRLAATAADNVGVSSVDFLVDGRVVGSTQAPPYSIEWDSSTATKGVHTLTARATDPAGNVGTSAAVPVSVDNSGRRPALIVIDRKVVAQGTSTLRTSAVSVARGRLVLALVAHDGPEGGRQESTVTSNGLTWTLVNRLNSQTGTAEIWSTYVKSAQSALTVTAAPKLPGYDGQLTVMALRGAAGLGVSGVSGRQNGGPSIYLPGVSPASQVLAVGNDSDGAVTVVPVAGQVIQSHWAHLVPPTVNDADNGSTFWVQSLSAPTTSSGLVTLYATSPTTHQWNMTAVEVKASGAPTGRTTRTVPDSSLPTAPTRPGGHHG